MKKILILLLLSLSWISPTRTHAATGVGVGTYATQQNQAIRKLLPALPASRTQVPTINKVQSVSSCYGATCEIPVRLVVPSIGLDVPIEPVGLNSKGEMAVPDGKTKNTGWYRGGTIPGDKGSAVIAAHVYAAFKNLDRVKPGSDIYIISNGNQVKRFVAAQTASYPLRSLEPKLLFNRKDKVRLNLITCAGKYIPSLGTYDKRLVVFAELVPSNARATGLGTARST